MPLRRPRNRTAGRGDSMFWARFPSRPLAPWTRTDSGTDHGSGEYVSGVADRTDTGSAKYSPLTWCRARLGASLNAFPRRSAVAGGQDHSPLHQLKMEPSRDVAIRSSGPLGGEGGNLLATPAPATGIRRNRVLLVRQHDDRQQTFHPADWRLEPVRLYPFRIHRYC
jgi:hypothetical protein